MDVHDQALVKRAEEYLASGHVGLHILDDAPRPIDEWCRWARGIIFSEQPCALVLDYLGLLEGKGRSLNEQVASISRSVRAVALQTNTPIIAVHQLNRGSDNDRGLPGLSRLRDSGQLEQDATAVGIIHRMASAMPQYGLSLHDVALVWLKSRQGVGEALIPLHVDYARSRITARARSHA